MSGPASSIAPSFSGTVAPSPEPQLPWSRISDGVPTAQTALVRIGHCALRETDLATVFADAAALVAGALSTPFVGVFETREPAMDLALRGGVGWTAASAEVRLPRLSHGPETALTIADVRRNHGSLAAPLAPAPLVAPLAPASVAATLAAAPLVRDNRVVALAAVAIPGGARPFGWLVVGMPTPRRFAARELDFLASVAALLGAALERAAVDAERAQALATLEEEAAISRALLELGRTLHSHLSDPYLLEWVNTAALRLLRCDWSGVLGWDDKRRVFRLFANAGVLPVDLRIAVAEVQYGADDVPRLRALRAGDLLELPSLEGEPILPGDLVRELGLRAALCTPVACGREVLGIHIHGWRDQRHAFRPRDRHLATGIAHATAVALDTALLVAELQTASRLKSEFLANVSHELRTPINIIAGYSEMLADGACGAVSSEAHQTLDRIHTTTRTLRDLVSSTLHLGRLEAGRDAVDTELVDVEALVRDVAAEITVPPAITLALPRLDDALQVTCDRGKLRTIIQQLVQNAVKFTDAGSVAVDVEHDGRYLSVTVRDTGVGVSAEHLPSLFQPFRQLDGSNTRRHGGVGLGLHLVKRLTTLLHGDVRVTSRPGKGSTFVVTLPAPLAS